jgi:hypothetical protein
MSVAGCGGRIAFGVGPQSLGPKEAERRGDNKESLRTSTTFGKPTHHTNRPWNTVARHYLLSIYRNCTHPLTQGFRQRI